MDRQQVSSSNIASIGFDPATNTLEVEFHDGSIYQYFGLPDHVYSELMGASSKGKYLNEHVKKAGYAYAKIA